VTALVIIEALVILLLGVLVAGLLRSHAEILRKLHDLGVHMDGENDHVDHGFNVSEAISAPNPVTSEAYDIAGATPGGDAVAITVIGARQPTLLAFLSTGCTTCAEFWTAMAEPTTRQQMASARLVVVTKGEADESPTAVGEAAPPGLPLVMSSEAWANYGVPGSPYFVLVDGPSGRVRGEGSAGTWEQLVKLMGEALGDTSGSPTRKARADAERERHADDELMASGIHPGHPSLYENPEGDAES